MRKQRLEAALAELDNSRRIVIKSDAAGEKKWRRVLMGDRRGADESEYP